jgi:hypothetical protein
MIIHNYQPMSYHVCTDLSTRKNSPAANSAIFQDCRIAAGARAGGGTISTSRHATL